MRATSSATPMEAVQTPPKSKARGLGGDQFFCVDNLELVTRVNSTLFNTSSIMDWAHQGGGELEEGAAGGQPVGQVQQAGISLVTSSSIDTSNDMLLEDGVKGSLLVQKQDPKSNAIG